MPPGTLSRRIRRKMLVHITAQIQCRILRTPPAPLTFHRHRIFQMQLSLVEKKTRLIELLQEKRTTLITHAVTKGLNPNVTMRDSGIEWLGQIPAHWKIKRNALLFKIGFKFLIGFRAQHVL